MILCYHRRGSHPEDHNDKVYQCLLSTIKALRPLKMVNCGTGVGRCKRLAGGRGFIAARIFDTVSTSVNNAVGP